MCDRVHVMYAGQDRRDRHGRRSSSRRPRHPYTLGLLQSVPAARRRPQAAAARRSRARRATCSSRRAACPFAPRCRFALERVPRAVPPLERDRARPPRRLLQPRARERVGDRAEGGDGVSARSSGRGRGPQGLVPDQERARARPPRRRRARRSTASRSRSSAARRSGLVGESGCGKSTVGRAILRLLRADGGPDRLRRRGHHAACSERELRPLRRRMQMVFQDPYASLNPRHIGRAHRRRAAARARDRRPARATARACASCSSRVGLPPDARDRYPHEFSGGQRQRIGIARALALNPTSSSATSRCRRSTSRSRRRSSTCSRASSASSALTYLFIAHDLAVVRHISDRIAVMYLGEIVEVAPADDLYDEPAAPVHDGAALGGPDPRPRGRAQAGADPARRATCRARPTRRPAAASTRAARTCSRPAAATSGRCCGRSAATRSPATSPRRSGPGGSSRA